MKSFFRICILALWFISTAPAFAHYPWVSPKTFNLEPRTPLEFTIGWGHHFPVDGQLPLADVKSAKIIGPVPVGTQALSETRMASQGPLTEPGTYVVSVARTPGFYTKTAQGGKRASKKGLNHVIRCSFSHMTAKAIVNVGSPTGKADAVAGHSLEIIPRENPAGLKAGDALPVTIHFMGKPFRGEWSATHDGFSQGKNAFAHSGSTDADGQAMIPISAPGVWLIKASHNLPYPDTETCDWESFVATLTFEIN